MVTKQKDPVTGKEYIAVKDRTLRKFHAHGNKSIDERMVEGETDTMIIVGYDRLLQREVRYKKRSVDEAWCDTWEEAHQFLIAKVKKEVDAAARCLKSWQDSQAGVLALKPPTPEK